MTGYLRLHEEPPYDEELADSEVLAIRQLHDAQELLHEDKTGYPRFKRLTGIHALTGSMAPGEIWMLGAQVGSGKSLLCQNLMDDLIEQRVQTLYIGTEQDSHVLKLKHACMRAGVSPRLMLKPEDDMVNTDFYRRSVEAVEAEMEWLCSKEISKYALFANCEYVNQAQLNKWIRGGVRKYNVQCVIVDHIDQVEHGTGQNAVHEATASVQLLHNLAREFQMPIVIANQLKRSQEPMKRYAPPEAQDFAGTSAKERVASVMLGLWRPLRTDLSIEDLRDVLKAAKHGGTSEDKVYQENTMGVRLLKDRLGTAPGRQCKLFVGKGGKLEDDHAATHGITSRGL